MDKLFEMLQPDEDRVFQKMIDRPYNGKVLFSHLSKMSPLDFLEDTGNRNYIQWFRRHPDKFAIFEGNDGRVAMFAVLVKNAKLCQKICGQNLENKDQKACTDMECQRFHVCQKFIGGDCTGAKCPFDHHFQSDHSRKLLQCYNLNNYSDNDLMTIFRQSQLQICGFYDLKGSCDHEDRCTKIHICADFVLGTCPNPCPKKLRHNFETDHTQRLLRIYDLHDRPVADVLSQLLIISFHGRKKQNPVNDNDEFLRKLTACLLSLNPEEEDDDVNYDGQSDLHQSQKLNSATGFKTKAQKSLGEAKTDEKLEGEAENCDDQKQDVSHELCRGNKEAPWHWEINIFGTWMVLDKKQNQKLEEVFCDPATETVNITIPEVEGCSFDMTVDFSKMTANLLEGQEELELRRQADPNDSWLWYYETDDGKWDPYSEDDQVVLETGFVMKEKRVYVGKREKYRIKFSEFNQKNRETGKGRRIKRRPIYTAY